MVWIVSKEFSKETFHHSRWKLDWNNTHFLLTGNNISVKLDNINNNRKVNSHQITYHSKIESFNTYVTKS